MDQCHLLITLYHDQGLIAHGNSLSTLAFSVVSIPITIIIIFGMTIVPFILTLIILLLESDIIFLDGTNIHQDLFQICCPISTPNPMTVDVQDTPSIVVRTPFNSRKVTNCLRISPSL